jgi:N-acetylglucosamine-6-sulfatase
MSKRLSRREALRRVAVGAGAAMGLGLSRMASAAGRGRRPNVLFILTDDHRWDAMSCMGHPFVKTPNMDRLAKEGARFANGFVTISLCAPSRACFLTGLYAHSHGVRTNEGQEFDHSLPTFPLLLRKAGYDTAFIGKWHMAPTAEPRPGFDYWLSFVGQGEYVDPRLNENGNNFTATGYMTDLLTDYAVKWLERPRGKPFCLYLAHKAVHGPFTPADRHKGVYAQEKMAKPPSFDDTFEGKPEWLRAAIVRGGRREEWLKNKDKPVPPSLPPTEWDPSARARLDYYESLLAVDEGVGRVFQTLERLGAMDDTVIVFCGDNGFFMGEHQRGDKRLMYEESIRIPFLLRYPPLARAGTVVDEMVLNIDVAPTLLDLAGADVPAHMQGRSVRPLLDGTRGAWRSSWLYEYYEEAWLPSIPTMQGVRTKSWNYTTYPEIDDLDELYDLRDDPHEMRNLAQDPAHEDKLRGMKQELQRLQRDTAWTPPKPRAVFRPARLVLSYTFDKLADNTVTDESGNGNNGTIVGAVPVSGRRGTGLRFAGKEYVEVANSKSLNPARKSWSAEAWVQADSPDGVILARGGQTMGYALHLRGGVPVFTVRVAGSPTAAVARRGVNRMWHHLVGVLTGEQMAKLYVDGELAASARVPALLPGDPNDAMQIGQDRASAVGDYEGPNGFGGVIDEVRVYDGELTASQIRHAYGAR